ncbi:hypothetical protein Adt_31998 [Abeliophyllum distichum]|uniref:Uncharacterized protein n=1 Tax=Abeliophyllum distichum TaxID=126358 RepID=A0ABD1RFQ3_9LAMI
MKVMSSKNINLGLENRALRYRLDALVAVDADWKARLESTAENLRHAHSKRRLDEATKKLVEDYAAGAENTVISINCDFDAMVAEKEKQLAEANRDLEKMKDELVEVGVRAMRSYKKEFSSTPEYSRLTNRFMVSNGE